MKICPYCLGLFDPNTGECRHCNLTEKEIEIKSVEFDEKYCEWDGVWIDNGEWEYKTDCGHNIKVTKESKYYKLIKARKEICPFCGKEITQYSYD
jgi:Zn-finger nucleic acid-binding protein